MLPCFDVEESLKIPQNFPLSHFIMWPQKWYNKRTSGLAPKMMKFQLYNLLSYIIIYFLFLSLYSICYTLLVILPAEFGNKRAVQIMLIMTILIILIIFFITSSTASSLDGGRGTTWPFQWSSDWVQELEHKGQPGSSTSFMIKSQYAPR